MRLPDAAHHTLAGLLAVLGRPPRFRIEARPEDRDRQVTTAALWACGCQAEGVSYQELLLAPCAAHTLSAKDPDADRLRLSPPG